MNPLHLLADVSDQIARARDDRIRIQHADAIAHCSNDNESSCFYSTHHQKNDHPFKSSPSTVPQPSVKDPPSKNVDGGACTMTWPDPNKPAAISSPMQQGPYPYGPPPPPPPPLHPHHTSKGSWYTTQHQTPNGPTTLYYYTPSHIPPREQYGGTPQYPVFHMDENTVNGANLKPPPPHYGSSPVHSPAKTENCTATQHIRKRTPSDDVRTQQTRNAANVALVVNQEPYKNRSPSSSIHSSTSAENSNRTQQKQSILKRTLSPIETTRNEESTQEGEPNPFDELKNDPELEFLVTLEMAKQRQTHGNQFHPHGIPNKNTDSPSNSSSTPGVSPPSAVISEGFFWREYPACEQVLHAHMRQYFDILSSSPQKRKDNVGYRKQKIFNSDLIEKVRQTATDNGWTVDPNFTDTKLRDRIRCFYKTHLQNAKKRLATLQKHTNWPANRSLIAVYIRCVRDPELSFEESLNMAEETNKNNERPKKTPRRYYDKVERMKLSVKLKDTAPKP